MSSRLRAVVWKFSNRTLPRSAALASGFLAAALLTPVVGCGSSNGSDSSTGGGSTGTGASSASGTGSGTAAGGNAGGSGVGGAPLPLPGGTALSECEKFVSGDELKVCSAGYSSSSGDDDVGGIALAPNGVVVVGGALGPKAVALPAKVLLDGGAQGVSLYSPSGRELLSATALGGRVDGVSVDSSGHIGVVGSFGLAVLSADGETLLWSKALRGGSGTRVSQAKDGSVAAAAGNKVDLFDASGNALGEVDIDQNRELPSLALDSTNQLLYAAGFNQRDGGDCTQLQVPFLRAYDYSGALVWKNYDWTHAEAAAADECADSRGYHVTLGEDGKLYYAGESHGGNSVHRRMPRDLSTFAPNVKPDSYQDGYNMNGAAPMGYIARFEPKTGAIEVGSTFVVRLASSKGNTLRPRAVAATSSGHVAFVGASACCIENAEAKTINGIPSMPTGTYAGGGFLMILSPDFEKRLAWTAFNGATGGDSNGVGVAARGGAIAALFEQGSGDAASIAPTAALLTSAAVQPEPGGGKTDSYFTVLRAPE